MIMLGKTARSLREAHGITQRHAAQLLNISAVHLSNVENNKSVPSPTLLERYRRLWGIDLYVLAWCLHGDVSKLPAGIRKPASELAAAWSNQLSDVANRRREAHCSTSDE